MIETSQGDLVQHNPIVYQEIGGKRREVAGRYVMRASRRVGFQVASYDATRPLVIDPVLTYSTYLGGGGNDVGNAIAVDSNRSAYVTGVTTSPNFPGTSVNPIQSNWAGSNDVFVTRLGAAGNGVVYSTYLGGSLAETGFAIAVDSSGNAYVTGETDSSTTAGNTPFPTVGAIQPLYGLGGDVFSYTDPVLTSGVSTIKAVHIQELRWREVTSQVTLANLRTISAVTHCGSSMASHPARSLGT